jgi:TolB-like protein/Tfp pilus assembly protein PilF
MMSLIAELRRRNVFKVTTAYLALGWVVIESGGTVASVLRLPDWSSSFLFWLGLAGLPFVIVFAWVFELTPEGLQRTREVDPTQSITPLTSRRLDYVIIALLLVAIGFFAAERFLPRSEPPAVPVSTATTSDEVVGRASARQDHVVGLQPDVQHAAQPSVPPGAQPAAALAPDDKSIAVLPFVNMSSDKEQEYFSDGMSEELLNLLAQAHDLKVIARTSSFAFKGKDVPIAEIARQLNVAHVLEGSVRKAGNTVRITAQLIRAADSVHLWSETYDRPLDDIFSVQSEIAKSIAQALQIRLAGGELDRRKGGTQNLEAFELYLRAASSNAQNTKSSLEAATRCLEQAIALDPHYGAAMVLLETVIHNAADGGHVGVREAYARSRKLAATALESSPDLASAHAALQYIHTAFDWDWSAAETEGRLALDIDPADATALNSAGVLSYSLGQWSDAERQLLAALERNPLDSFTIWNLGFTYYGAGRFGESERVLRRLLEMQPAFGWARIDLGKILLVQHKTEEALAVVQQERDEGARIKLLPILLHASGRLAEADQAAKAQISRWADTGAYFVAMTYAYRGDHDQAMVWLERAYAQKDTWLICILGEHLFSSMSDDPRFKAFLRKMNLPTEPVPVNWQ